MDPAPVFIGGAVTGLFLDELGRSQLRVTEDVDCIVPELTSTAGWWALEQALRGRGWAPAPDGPVCRYRSPSGALVDLVAQNPSVQGFAGQWFSVAVARARRVVLASGSAIRVPPVEVFFACKLEAFADRGRHDPWQSKDLEDLVTLVDCAPALVSSVGDAAPELRGWVARSVRELLLSPAVAPVLAGHLPRGGDEIARARNLRRRLQALAALSQASGEPPL